MRVCVYVCVSGGATGGPVGHWPTQFSVWPTLLIVWPTQFIGAPSFLTHPLIFVWPMHQVFSGCRF